MPGEDARKGVVERNRFGRTAWRSNAKQHGHGDQRRMDRGHGKLRWAFGGKKSGAAPVNLQPNIGGRNNCEGAVSGTVYSGSGSNGGNGASTSMASIGIGIALE